MPIRDARYLIMEVSILAIAIPLFNALTISIPRPNWVSGQLIYAGINSVIFAFMIRKHRWSRWLLGALVVSQIFASLSRSIATPGFLSFVFVVELSFYLAMAAALFFGPGVRQWFAKVEVSDRANFSIWVCLAAEVLLVLAIVAAVYLSGPDDVNPHAGKFSIANTVDSAPPGYATPARLLLAIINGQEPMVSMGEKPANTRVEFDVEYCQGGGRPLRLDIASPQTSTDTPLPAIIFIHGGGWAQGDKTFKHRELYGWAARGYVTLSIEYRLAQESKFPGAIEDVTCAIRWLRENGQRYSVDINRIALVGYSAGAHLAMLAGYGADQSALKGEVDFTYQIKSIVNFYGPSNLEMEFPTDSQTLVNDFLGDAVDAPRLASPLTHITANAPPTLIFHGTNDSIVPIEQADILASKLETLAIPYSYHRLNGWDHGMDAFERMSRYIDTAMTDFFETHL